MPKFEEQLSENDNTKCQCPEEGRLDPSIKHLYHKKTELPFVVHEPYQCKCTNNIKLFERQGKKLFLCSICCLSEDKEIEK